jgi:anti-sigma-K factor RskA
MSHDNLKGLLNDFVDGTLDTSARQRVGRHLESCDACREEVAALRSLTADLRALPKEMTPPADLWLEIARQTGQTRPSVLDFEEAQRRRSGWSGRWRLAVAAALLVACSSALTLYLSKGLPDKGLALRGKGHGTSALQTELALVNVAGTYSGTVQALHKTLRERRADLSPETLREVERNLSIIDAAISATQAALATDPEDRDLIRTVSAMYEQKIALLQDANELPNGS